MTELARLHAVVYGHVQGVNFRTATRRQGQALGVSGWVRNLPDGSVEVIAEGQRSSLQQLLNWLHSGPPASRVRDVRFTWHEYEGALSQFSVRF